MTGLVEINDKHRSKERRQSHDTKSYIHLFALHTHGPRREKTMSLVRPPGPYSNKPAQLLDRERLEYRKSLVVSVDMILLNKQLTKSLTRLGRCAGWSAPLLFTNLKDILKAKYVLNIFATVALI